MTISCDNCGKPFDWEPWPGLVHQMFHYCGRPECNAEMKARADAMRERVKDMKFPLHLMTEGFTFHGIGSDLHNEYIKGNIGTDFNS